MKSFLFSLIDIDTRSLIVAIIWTNFVALSIPLTYYVTNRKHGERSLPITLFALSKLCQILCFALILSRPLLPDLLSIYVANVLFFVALGLEAYSCYDMLGQKNATRTRNLATGVLVGAVLFCVSETIFHAPALRIVAACFAVIIILLPPGIHLLFTKKNALYCKALGLFVLLFMLIQVPRLINALLHRDLVILTNDTVESMTMISLLLLTVVSASMLFLTLMDSLHQAARETSEEQRRAVDAAKEATRVKSTFLANMSHEIRTPMNGIIGFAELALAEPGLPRKTMTQLGKILQSSHTLLQIINDVMDISRIEAGCVELDKIPFTLHDVFTACDSMATPKAKEKNLTLYIYAEPFVGGKLLGDPKRLRQIIMNLLSNAVKFTNFGMIKLTAHVNEYRPDSVDISFEVKDSGIGMTEEELQRVFSSFSQADPSSTRKYGGAGLGLAISKGLVELMGGELEVQSTPGLGSKVSFRLVFPVAPVDEPIVLPESGAAPEDSSAANPVARPDATPLDQAVPAFSGHVLVLEDNEINQEVIAEHLRAVGVTFTIVANGRAGLEQVKAHTAKGTPFDLIFMDIHMPILGGIETAQALQSMYCQTPIIALTANVMSNDRDLYRRHGMTGFLAKPFQAQELWAILAQHLHKAEATEQPEGECAILNREAGIRQAAGNDQLYRRQLDNFVKYQSGALTDIIEAVRKGDMDAAKRRAHALRGVARNIGAERLFRAASTALEMFDAGNGADCHIEAMDQELRALLETLEQSLA